MSFDLPKSVRAAKRLPRRQQQVLRGLAEGKQRKELADELRMERDMVQHSFYDRPGAASEVMEGIRALVIDKDYTPKWNPARIEDVKPGMADEFFVSPWTAETHPLQAL